MLPSKYIRMGPKYRDHRTGRFSRNYGIKPSLYYYVSYTAIFYFCFSFIDHYLFHTQFLWSTFFNIIKLLEEIDFAMQCHLQNTLINGHVVRFDTFRCFDTFLYARLKNGRIMLWQCPSVCPSVRPSVRVFRTFFQRALRYQFETWYMHSVGGTTCRVWVSSQLGHFDLVYSQK